LEKRVADLEQKILIDTKKSLLDQKSNPEREKLPSLYSTKRPKEHDRSDHRNNKKDIN